MRVGVSSAILLEVGGRGKHGPIGEGKVAHAQGEGVGEKGSDSSEVGRERWLYS